MSVKEEQVTGKVFFKTFGCQMNEYDSGKMRAMLGKALAKLRQRLAVPTCTHS